MLNSALRNVRLTGVVIAPGLRRAIFAETGTASRVLSEGETLKGLQLASVSPDGVVLSGPAGDVALEPQPDDNLVRPPLPVAVHSGSPGPAMAAVPGPSIVVSPIVVGNLSPATSSQTQGYAPYFPAYYPASDPSYPSGWGWGNRWGWGWPVAVSGGFGGCRNCGFRGGSFRHAFKRFGFAHAGFGGGFRGGGRR